MDFFLLMHDGKQIWISAHASDSALRSAATLYEIITFMHSSTDQQDFKSQNCKY